jgi:hypothetical protein
MCTIDEIRELVARRGVLSFSRWDEQMGPQDGHEQSGARSSPAIYMNDANIFNSIVEDKISVAEFAGSRLLATFVEHAELAATPNSEKRDKLLSVFGQIPLEVIAAESALFDVPGCGFDQAKWNDGSGLFEKMHARLLAKGVRRKSQNQLSDVSIAETAIKKCAILVSDDPELRQVVLELGGRALDHRQFLPRS